MASKKRGGLGRGIGALIPQAPNGATRPVDVFFPGQITEADKAAGTAGGAGGSADKKRETPQQPAAVIAASKAAAAVKNSEAADSTLREVPGATLTELELTNIVPNRVQPRTEFEETALAELTHSIKEFGVFQPVVVRRITPEPAAGEPRFELIMGERRFRASGRAGKTTIPALIRETSDENMLRDALLENLHRAELNPLEEASAYQQLMADFSITQEELSKKIGRSRPQISNTIRLLRLPEPVQAKVAAGVLSAGHARAILSLDGDPEAMQKLADKIINESLSVREAENAANAEPKKKKARVRAGGRQHALAEVGERLGDRLNTRVTVKLGAKKGQIVIDFATPGDLNRILRELDDPGLS